MSNVFRARSFGQARLLCWKMRGDGRWYSVLQLSAREAWDGSGSCERIINQISLGIYKFLVSQLAREESIVVREAISVLGV